MIQLHGFSMSPNTRRARLALEELAVPYTFVEVDLMSGEQRGEKYRALNPTRKVDREALALLDKVAALTKDEAKRLARLVEQTHHVEDAPAPVDSSAETARTETLRALYTWLTAWSDIARTVITRRDHLIRLGLAKRRPAQSKSKPVTPPPATPVTPTVTSSLDEHGPDSRAA